MIMKKHGFLRQDYRKIRIVSKGKRTEMGAGSG
jgi:hypothetical protein